MRIFLVYLRVFFFFVPNLRFDGIPWKSVPLNMFAKKIIEKNINNRIKNVICNSANEGLVFQNDFFDRKIANLENTNGYYVINFGDFVYNPRKSTTAKFGPVNIYEYSMPGIVSPLYLCFKVDNINKRFLYYYFKSSKWHRYIYLNGDTGARHDRVSIKDDVFLSQPITFPSLETQEKIAKFLKLIDERIETQSKIIEDLKSEKNKISQSIFKNKDIISESAPLKEFATLKNGYAFKSSSYVENGTYIVLTIANVSGERNCSFEKYNTISAVPKDIQSHQLLKENDILISLTGNVGRVSYCSIENALLNQRVGVLDFFDKEYAEYIFQVISMPDFAHSMQNCGQGAAQLNIGKSDVENYMIPFSKDKHVLRCIALLLSAYDKKIQTEKDILSAYKKQKAYLLKEMFI